MIPARRELWLVVLLALQGAVLGHDFGVLRATLTELPSGGYRLETQVPDGVVYRYKAPVLPERFTFVGDRLAHHGSDGMLRFEFASEEGPLYAGDRLDLAWPHEGLMVVMTWSDGTRVTRLYESLAGSITIDMGQLRAGSGSVWMTFERYLRLGVEHILSGVDHLIFVVGLLFLVRGRWVLAKTITAFTVAHSLTLGVATFGWLTPTEPTVNVLIAMSILFLGPEMVRAQRGETSLTIRSPWVVAFGFGLLHGFGFASGLSSLGMPGSEIPLALLAFNVGVEIGQLGFVLILLMLAAATRALAFEWGRASALLPAYTVGTLGAYWTLSRLIIFLGAGL
ncbi:HupE/UreJ family protein [Mucisphaera calidilacus]|uniref:HupE / UreJ protein n=1 Tax=Mucisphaera calidilacus TaxID=2527982 RepID=A0A518BYI0_9BACT|nr:HupE/UreJ family protein [Mucisphaera calidilacus]QDU72029.1 hypothetical protein Pan265_18890 [Mucisphaera calidilacus]